MWPWIIGGLVGLVVGAVVGVCWFAWQFGRGMGRAF